MRTVVVGPRPPELEAAIKRRALLGIDLFDEVWEGDYHMAPAPHGRHAFVDGQLAELLGRLARQKHLIHCGPLNIGEPDDYRVPDRALLKASRLEVFNPTAVMVIEIRSPEDETYDKLPFYFAHDVGEVLIVDPSGEIQLYVSGEDGYTTSTRSLLLDLTTTQIREAIDWPA